MRRLSAALYTYANENNGAYPPDLTMLYPKYVSDPTVFWHPGDSDPAPTTINNNGANQSNSTRISYEFATNPETLCELQEIDGPVLLSLAVRIGKARLIDNFFYWRLIIISCGAAFQSRVRHGVPQEGSCSWQWILEIRILHSAFM